VDAASQGGYSWPIANWEQRYATYLQREIRTVPVRSEDGETRLGDRGLLRARAGATAQAAGAVGGLAAQSRLGRGGGSPSLVATVRPRTRGRGWRAADAAGPTGACAYARPRRRVGVGVGVGARRPVDGRRASGLRPVDAQVRRATRDGATVVGAEWRLLRRGFDYPDDTAKAGTRVRVGESGGGVRTSRPVTTEACARWSPGWVVIVVLAEADLVGVLIPLATRRKPGCGSALCRHGAIPCLRAHAQVAA